jgi:5'-nucleotidase
MIYALQLRSRKALLLATVVAAGIATATIATLARAAETPRDLAGVVTVPWPPPLEPVTWRDEAVHTGPLLHIKLLGFNDFHGGLLPTRRGDRPVGGAAVFAAYLTSAARVAPEHTLIVHAGDHLGASPPITRLLQNEPAIDFLNLLGNEYCRYGDALTFHDAANWKRRPNRCNVVGTLGNHEFDAGLGEIRRLLGGGNAAEGPFLDDPYRGSRAPYVSSNVIERANGRTVLPPYTVAVIAGMPIGVIGAVLRDTPTIVPAASVADVEFLDEAESINRAVVELKKQGVHTIIVTIHQGLVPIVTDGVPGWRGPLLGIVAKLDPEVDVVVAGHMHSYTNGLLPNSAGKPVLVTQSFAEGMAFADIDLTIDPRTRDVVAKSAVIVPTFNDVGPGLHPDARAAALMRAAEQTVAERVTSPLGQTAALVSRATTAGGESPIGNLVADAQRAATGADMALMNAGGLRADLPAGTVTLGDVLTLHPFANRLVTFDLTGAQVLQLLEEQWHTGDGARLRMLKTSGLNYIWDPVRPIDQHVVVACDANGASLSPTRSYRVTINDFLASGGDDFKLLKSLTVSGSPGRLDSDAVAAYFAAQSKPIEPRTEGRIVRLEADPARMPASLCKLP